MWWDFLQHAGPCKFSVIITLPLAFIMEWSRNLENSAMRVVIIGVRIVKYLRMFGCGATITELSTAVEKICV